MAVIVSHYERYICTLAQLPAYNRPDRGMTTNADLLDELMQKARTYTMQFQYKGRTTYDDT